MSKKTPKNKPETSPEVTTVETEPSEAGGFIRERGAIVGEAVVGVGEHAGEESSDGIPPAVTQEALSGDAVEAPPLAHVLEAILFASQKAVTPKELATHLKSAAAAEPNSAALAFARIKESEIRAALDALQSEVAASDRAYQVRETATGWLLSSAPGYAPWLRVLYPEAKATRLSASALETLAIIAYRQPITRADMEAVRGVSVDGVMQTLLDRGLVKIAGRAEVPGRPLLYATTQYFLDHFGLRTLDELPNAAELRHVQLPKALPESGGATVPDNSTPELPGVSERGPDGLQFPEEHATEFAPESEVVDVTEILDVRESVVFEEIAFDENGDDEASGSMETTDSGNPLEKHPEA